MVFGLFGILKAFYFNIYIYIVALKILLDIHQLVNGIWAVWTNEAQEKLADDGLCPRSTSKSLLWFIVVFVVHHIIDTFALNKFVDQTNLARYKKI